MDLKPKTLLIHIGLFVVTFVTTTLAGSEWVYGKSIFIAGYSWVDFADGMNYSVPFLLILTVHEFGHYFTAIHYKVSTTLPYFIPLPSTPFLPMFGTMGALIRLKSRVHTKQQNFDIGIAGPLAGFIVTIIVLWYGFATLPPPEYVFQFHPEYKDFGLAYADHVYSTEYLQTLPQATMDVTIGKNLLFVFFEKFVGDPSRVPNIHEIMHYPFLFAGFLSLVFTSINLLPIGQLDGGHVLYGLLGFRGHRKVASVVFVAFLFYGSLGLIQPDGTPFFSDLSHLFNIILFVGFLYLCLTGLRIGWKNHLMIAFLIFGIQYVLTIAFPGLHGYSGWLLFTFLIGRMMGVLHPPSEIEDQLTPTRMILGWIALLIFVISFAPTPIELDIILPATPPAPQSA